MNYKRSSMKINGAIMKRIAAAVLASSLVFGLVPPFDLIAPYKVQNAYADEMGAVSEVDHIKDLQCGDCNIAYERNRIISDQGTSEEYFITISPIPGSSGSLDSTEFGEIGGIIGDEPLVGGGSISYEWVSASDRTYGTNCLAEFASTVNEVIFDEGVKLRKNSANLFRDFKNLETVRFGDADFSAVRNTSAMFAGCSNLRSIDMGNFDTSAVTDMWAMFQGCEKLESIAFKKFDTSSVTDMAKMFSGCSSLKSIDLANFDTSKVTSMDYMFRDCSSLVTLDLSRFNISKIEKRHDKDGDYLGLYGMFQGCTNLRTIFVGKDFVIDKNLYYDMMFHGCTNLIGGKGTCYNPKHTDSDYAHIDSVEDPGYFTLAGTQPFSPSRPLPPHNDSDSAFSKKNQSIIVKNKKKGKSKRPWKGYYLRVVKAKKLKKRSVGVECPISVNGAQGKVSFKRLSGKKAIKKFKVNARTGNITVPKKAKKGTYTLKIQVRAAGNASYNPATKCFVVKIKVK